MRISTGALAAILFAFPAFFTRGDDIGAAAPQVIATQTGEEFNGLILPGLSDQGLILPAPNTIVVGPQDETHGSTLFTGFGRFRGVEFQPRAFNPAMRSFQDHRGLGIGFQGSSTAIGPQSSEPQIGEQGSQPIVPGLSDQGLIFPTPNSIAVAADFNARVQPFTGTFLGPQGLVPAPQGFGSAGFHNENVVRRRTITRVRPGAATPATQVTPKGKSAVSATAAPAATSGRR